MLIYGWEKDVCYRNIIMKCFDFIVFLFLFFLVRVYSLFVFLYRLVVVKLNMEIVFEDVEYMVEEFERWKKGKFDIDKK